MAKTPHILRGQRSPVRAVPIAPIDVALPTRMPRMRFVSAWIRERIHKLEQYRASVPFDRRRFVYAWGASFTLLVITLTAVGFAPAGVTEPIQETIAFLTFRRQSTEPIAVPDFVAPAETGPRIAIPALGIHAPLVFPKSTDIDALNNALTTGVVHYPTSAKPGDTGNVFLFGHSTGLAVVHNKNFEVFNNLKNAKPGDAIRIRYGERDYLYVIEAVKAETASTAKVDLQVKGKKLTLSTCNVWGGKEARTVVEAEFVRSYPVRTLASSLDSSL